MGSSVEIPDVVITSAAVDVVGGRLTYVDTTTIKWGFVDSNQIRLWDDTTSAHVIIECASEPTLSSTANDMNGDAITYATIYDVFGVYGSATSMTLAAAKWAVSTAGSSARTAAWATAAATQTWAKTLNGDSTSLANASLRNVHSAASLTTSGSSVRVTLKAHSAIQSVYPHVCIAEHAGGGDAAGTFGGSKFKEFLFSGNQGVTIAANGTATSDWLAFDVDETKEYLTIVAGDANGYSRWLNTGSDGLYDKGANAADWNVQDISGYIWNAGYSQAVSKLEVLPNYTVGQRVSNSGSYYPCLVTHCPGTFATDLAAGKWGPAMTGTGDLLGLDIGSGGYPIYSNTGAWRGYRWLGVIITYNDTGSKFRNTDNDSSIGNYYNAVPRRHLTANTTTSWACTDAPYRVKNNGTNQVRGNFIVAKAQYCMAGNISCGSSTSGGQYTGVTNLDSDSAITTTPTIGAWCNKTTTDLVSAVGTVFVGFGAHYVTELESGATGVTGYGNNSYFHSDIMVME